MELELG